METAVHDRNATLRSMHCTTVNQNCSMK